VAFALLFAKGTTLLTVSSIHLLGGTAPFLWEGPEPIEATVLYFKVELKQHYPSWIHSNLRTERTFALIVEIFPSVKP
jgi:hypothetical protein